MDIEEKTLGKKVCTSKKPKCNCKVENKQKKKGAKNKKSKSNSYIEEEKHRPDDYTTACMCGL